MRRFGTVGVLVVVVLALAMATSVVALPLLGGGVGPFEDGATTDAAAGQSDQESDPATEAEAIHLERPTDGDASRLSSTHEEAVERGVDAGIELVQEQGVTVTQEQRAAALEGAREAAAGYDDAGEEHVESAAKGAVHGTFVGSQRVNASQVQATVGGSSEGALGQYQTANVTQVQHAAWGASHGAVAQKSTATVEQLQYAAYGGAAGAAHEAGEKDVGEIGTVQEAGQGAAYGAIAQYQTITVEQRQQITIEHLQHAAAGASAGALEGTTEIVLEQEQRIDVEQRQHVTIKQVQKAAKGAAKGALVQKQTVTVEQTQAAARGAGKGALKQVQTIEVTQIQRISITQIQEASFGAAKGAIVQSQEATVEQIQAAADGAAGGALVQKQEVSVMQVQKAATGAAKGTVDGALQHQVVEVEQLQAASFGAAEGAVTQVQIVNVVQVQVLAEGAASGVLSQAQEATVTQIQSVAKGTSTETAKAVQYQRVSVTQLQVLVQESAAEGTAYAVTEEIDDEAELSQHLRIEVTQRAETIDEPVGEASISFADQDSNGETVVIESVSLSEGGFVAIHDEAVFDGDVDAVRGVSPYLEPGDHEDVEIELDEPLEDDGVLYAVAHLDTDDDETFRYVETGGEADEPYVTGVGAPVMDGGFVSLEEAVDPDPGPEPEPEPEATLEVTDQEGDGDVLLIDRANATVDFQITAAYDGESVESEPFEANETLEAFELELEPPIESNTTIEVAIESTDEVDSEDVAGDNDDAEPLAQETIEYTVLEEPEPDPTPTATIDFADQDSEGTNVTVEFANLSEGGFVAIYDDFEVDEAGDLEAVDPDSVIGVSEYLEPGEHEELVVDLFDPEIPGSEFELDRLPDGEFELAAVAHNDTTEDETFRYLETDGEEDGPYVEASEQDEPADAVDEETGAPVGAIATVTVETEVTVEYLDCTTVEVTGAFDEGEEFFVGQTAYYTSGIGTSTDYTVAFGIEQSPVNVDTPFDGTVRVELGDAYQILEESDDEVVIEVPETGDFGAVISIIESTPGVEDRFDGGVSNPDMDACLEEIRPDEPEIWLEDVEVDVDGETLLATFGYDNPNEADMSVGSSFVAGTTDDEPPSLLEPGEETFTVEWTPDDEDERLVWEVDLSAFEYEDPLTVETEPASAYLPEPAVFDVEITGTNEPLEVGETLSVFVEAENVGERSGAESITASLEGIDSTPQEVDLEPGETTTLEFTFETDGLEPGTYGVSASSPDDSDETTVQLEAAAETNDDDDGLEFDDDDGDGADEFGIDDGGATETETADDDAFVDDDDQGQETDADDGEEDETDDANDAADETVTPTT